MIVIGGSAGSLEVLFSIVQALPAEPGAVVIVVVHRKNSSDSILANLLSTRTHLPVTEVEDKDPIHANHIYIAPADYHLLVEDAATFSLDSSEKVHYSRPSIDVTFESVAQVFGAKVVGVLLSGANADGAAGLQKIKQHQGITVVQDPTTAEVSFMPQQAINWGNIDRVVPGHELSAFISALFL